MDGVHMERRGRRSQQEEGEESSAGSASRSRAAKNAELEMAVLIQELMSLREERSELRARLFSLEDERGGLETALDSQRARTAALEAKFGREGESSGDEGTTTGAPPTQVLQRSSSEREEEMRGRIAELLQAVEKVKRTSEVRQLRQMELINELRETNS